MLIIKKFLFIFGCSLTLLMGCSNGNETGETKKEITIQNVFKKLMKVVKRNEIKQKEKWTNKK